ncbi:MAG: serine hydrolase [Planctomycetaceae bacterium]
MFAMLAARCVPLFVPAWIGLLVISSPAAAGETPAVFPGAAWERATPAEVGLDAAKLEQARKYALTGGGSGYVVRHGRLVMAWGDAKKKYDLKSTSKSIGVMALGLAIADGKIALDDLARKHHPTLGTPPGSNAQTGWPEKVTILHLATQTAGFEKPGGFSKLLFEPGTQWDYSDSGPNWLAECVTLAYRRDVEELLFERIFTPIGITKDDLHWRRNAYRPAKIEGIERREFGSGVHANVDAMARIGLLHLREGKWRDQQLLPAEFVRRARSTAKSVVGLPVRDEKTYGKASDHYGLLWWNNADGALDTAPRDAYWSWGLHESLIVVIPSLDLVASRAGNSWSRDWTGHYDVLRGFLEPLCAAVIDQPAAAAADANAATRTLRASGSLAREVALASNVQERAAAALPPSPVIAGIEWADKGTIVRQAAGSDNWPLAWADDGHLYTAYGDGWGFDPRVPQKLSLGLARVEGGPGDYRGVNIRSATAEDRGDDVRGTKASGMLMVDGVLYMLVRNAGNARLGMSKDRALTWTWADWRFDTSFGCPTFIDFGKNYAGARDEFVYVVSQDEDSAYKPTDAMVLARVPKDKLMERAAWEFFVRRDDEGNPVWTNNVADRGPVLENAGRCYRSGVSFDKGIGRYLWCNTIGADGRFAGGLEVYDAPEPWGPWTLTYSAEKWDVGPGETASFPPKWMSDDGRELHLVFSGDDAFSVRKARLLLRDDSR